MKLYTKTGDKGETGLFGGARVSKASLRVDAYGVVDELNAQLGLACALAQSEVLKKELPRIQGELFCVGSELASNPDKPLQAALTLVDDDAIERLESCIDQLESTLPPLTTFILSGGAVSACHVHVARTVCRRAERKVVALAEKATLRSEIIRYLNRLSDLLFVMARHENQRCGSSDVPWSGRAKSST